MKFRIEYIGWILSIVLFLLSLVLGNKILYYKSLNSTYIDKIESRNNTINQYRTDITVLEKDIKQYQLKVEQLETTINQNQIEINKVRVENNTLMNIMKQFNQYATTIINNNYFQQTAPEAVKENIQTMQTISADVLGIPQDYKEMPVGEFKFSE